MNVKTLCAIGLISIASLTSAMAYAKPQKSGFNMYRVLLSERGAERLSLSDAQQAQIKAIADTEKAAMKAFKTGKDDTRTQMAELVKAEVFDEVAFRQAIETGQNERLEFAVMKAKNKNKVWNILTTEQQEIGRASCRERVCMFV